MWRIHEVIGDGLREDTMAMLFLRSTSCYCYAARLVELRRRLDVLFRGYDSDLPFLLKLSWWLWFPIRKDVIYFKLYCMLYPLLELLSGKRGNILPLPGTRGKIFDI